MTQGAYVGLDGGRRSLHAGLLVQAALGTLIGLSGAISAEGRGRWIVLLASIVFPLAAVAAA